MESEDRPKCRSSLSKQEGEVRKDERCLPCLHISLFFELEYVYQNQKVKGEGLAEYLSEANPFLWDDVGSADPAIWVEFHQAFDVRFPSGEATDTDSLSFVRDYLAEQGAYYVRVFPGGDETPSSNCSTVRWTLRSGPICQAIWSDGISNASDNERNRTLR